MLLLVNKAGDVAFSSRHLTRLRCVERLSVITICRQGVLR